MVATILPFAPMGELPNRIYELRRAASLSQEELAFRIGKSKMHVSRLERGIGDLSLSVMRAIAEALGVHPVDLLSDDDNPVRVGDGERRIIATYRQANDDQRELLHRVTDAIVPFKHSAAKASS